MRIVVAMSGGVDSSVAAALLAEQGHEVIGLSMQLYDQSEGQTSFGSCCSIDDLHDARRVAAAIDIPHYIVNFEKQFNEQVISNFVSEYAAGRTPLPCAHCNSDLKFATLAERARGFGADAVATGHYARVERDANGRAAAAARRRRRQGPVVLPLLADPGAARRRGLPGRRSAEGRGPRDTRGGAGLPVADKPDSQEICFIPDNDYRSFVTRSVPDAAREGAFVDESGRVLGTPRRHSPLHGRPAQGARPRRRATGTPHVRAGAAPGRSAGRRRSEGVARADAADRVRRELDCRGAGGNAAGRPRRSGITTGGAGQRCDRSATDAPRSSSTSRSSRSRPARRWCSTTGTAWSAGAGSTDELDPFEIV